MPINTQSHLSNSVDASIKCAFVSVLTGRDRSQNTNAPAAIKKLTLPHSIGDAVAYDASAERYVHQLLISRPLRNAVANLCGVETKVKNRRQIMSPSTHIKIMYINA